MSKCIECRHWYPDARQCRVRAPSVLDGDPVGRWPVTEPGDWCGEFAGIHRDLKTGKRLDALEMQWRADDVWDAHLRARAKWFGLLGIAPQAPTRTAEIHKAIKAGLAEHDYTWMAHELRTEWRKRSFVRAAGIGLFLSPFHCGQNTDNTRYLEAWRPWRKRRGEADPITTFADLYFRKLAGEK